MKISICNEVFEGWPIEKVFEYAAQVGYNGVEIAPFTLADSVTQISPERRRAIQEGRRRMRHRDRRSPLAPRKARGAVDQRSG